MARRHHWTAADRAAFQAHKSAPPEALSTVSKQDLDVVFQPIVDLSTGKAMAFEALVRCKREQLRNPAVLFEVAVRQQFVGRLGRMIREVTFARCNDFPLFVNIHPGELAARWLV
ncbi:MAG: EAL domain-containing protein, partial [Myxococcota bacterium]